LPRNFILVRFKIFLMGLTMRQVAILFASLFFISLGAQAAEPAKAAAKYDAAKGKEVFTQNCAACHGADGNSASPAYPKLAGQHSEYIYKQLSNFKVQPGDKKAARENAVMAGMAAMLSEEDMHNVAAYLGSETMKPGSAKDKDTIALGQKIYRGGIAEKKVPACAGCHSPNGAGIPAQYPRVGGQHAAYTEAQLMAFSQGVRNNGPMMSTIAARLSEKEMKAVADYIAGLR
jgi:cbb3-type cytochrome c oxidase subunit III